jgi:antitoxin component YwqK of YwqJK toxin-antitoxin module
MKFLLSIALALISFFSIGQSNTPKTIEYYKKQYYVFPKHQKENSNPRIMCWTKKIKRKTIVTTFPKDGNWIQLFEEDKTRAAKTFEVKNGLPHGKYKRFDFNGQLKEKGDFFEGSRSGLWKMYNCYYPDYGTCDITSYYEPLDSGYYKHTLEPYHHIWWYRGLIDSRQYHKKGQLIAQEYYQNGRADSIWTEYYSTGNKKIEKHFIDGYVHGTYKEWYPNSQIWKELNYNRWKKNGLSKEWNEDGKIKCSLTYLNDSIIDGTCTFYYKNGKVLASGTIDEHVKVGHWTYWHKNGQKWAEGNFKAFTTTMCMSAMPSNYYHSVQTGEWSYWYATGKPFAKGPYDAKKTHISRGDLFISEKIGKWTYWDETGKQIKETKIIQPELFILGERQ